MSTTTPPVKTDLDSAIEQMNKANMQMLLNNIKIDFDTAASKAAKNKS